MFWRISATLLLLLRINCYFFGRLESLKHTKEKNRPKSSLAM